MSIATCPECEAELDLENPTEPRVGDRLICSECDAELEVISTKPLTVDYFFDDDDWDDDWEDE